MKIGWMWFDNSDENLVTKVERAARAYHAKHGRWPNTCYVNQRAITGDGFTCGTVRVVAARNILPHHFWLGVTNSQ